MIQELLGGVVEERKISIPGGLLLVDGSSPSANSSASSSTSSASSSPSSSTEQNQNLRCPRCDSPNTKFCYYNNYNLTQPRHFCKTCRRYWTKGGALRNVPIGGGCRKTKAPVGIVSSAGKSAAGKPKPSSPDVIGKSGLGGGGFDHELPSSPILWASPHNSHLLALLRATQIHNHNPNPNPNPNLNSVRIKDEGAIIGSHMVSEPLNPPSLSLDHLGQIPIGLNSSLWRNSSQYQYQQQPQQQQQQQQQYNMLLGEVPSSGIQELYQRFRSSGNYYTDQSQMVMSNLGSSASSCSTIASNANTSTTAATTTSTTILEPVPIAGGEFGYWNQGFSWSDLPTTNGAFP